MLYLLRAPLKAISTRQAGERDGIFRKNLVFLTLVWLCCSVVFFIDPQGIKLTGAVTNVWLILVLDVIVKVICGFTAEAQSNRVMATSAVSAYRGPMAPASVPVR